jgi:hypothetical protein
MSLAGERNGLAPSQDVEDHALGFHTAGQNDARLPGRFEGAADVEDEEGVFVARENQLVFTSEAQVARDLDHIQAFFALDDRCARKRRPLKIGTFLRQ